MQEGLVLGAVVAFLLGYFTQNMQLCMLTFAFSTLVVALVSFKEKGLVLVSAGKPTMSAEAEG